MSRPEPYAVEHQRSTERALTREAPPSTLAGMLRWYRQAWSEEMPERLHVRGVEWDRESGGSHLGTPRWTPTFRALIYACDTAHAAINEDGNFVWPCRAALSRMLRSKRPLLASWLVGVALADFDWRAFATAKSVPVEWAEQITRGALDILWRDYTVSPTVRVA